MEKTLSMGAFTELDEREVMETEGGFLQGFFDFICGVSVAEKRADKIYNNYRETLIQTIKNNPECVSNIPKASISYFNIHGVTGGPKGVTGNIW